MHPFFSTHKRTFFALIAAFFYSVAITYATPPLSPYNPAETLDPTCAPGDTNCSVSLYPDQTGQAGNVLTTNGTTVSWTTIPTSTNIYNTDGTLSANRTLTLSGNSLDIAGTTTTRFFNNGNVAIGSTTDDGYKLRVQGNTRVNGQLTAVGTGMIGGVTQSDFSSALASTFQVNHSNGNYGLQIINSSTANSGANLTLFKTRGGGTASTLGSVVNQDRVGNIYFQAVAANATTVALAAKIAVYAYPTGGFSYLANGAVPPNSSVPGMFEFATTGFNGVSDVSRMRLLPDGELMLGDGSVQPFNNYYRLQVNGSAYFTGKLLVGAPFATTSAADASSVFDVRSTTAGALLPRMTNAQRAAITTPATGLLTYSTDTTEGLYVNTSGGWQRFLTSGDTFSNIYTTDGSLTGARTLSLNANTLDIAGTTTTRFFANGNVGIGTTTDHGYKTMVNGTLRVSANNYWVTNGATALQVDGTAGFTDNIVLALAKPFQWGSAANQIMSDGSTMSFRVNSGTDQMTLFGSGNLSVGSTTDAGYKLDVNGSARITTNNVIYLNPATNQYGLALQPGSAGTSKIYATTNGGASLLQAFEFGFFTTSLNSSSGFSDPTGNNISFRLYGTHVASGPGGGTYTDFLINPTINMTGNANPGIYRGINFEPTLIDSTNTTITAFRNTIGNNIFNATSGNTLIGTSTDNGFKLQVNGTARVYNELSAWGGGFRLNRNGAEPYFAFHYNEAQVAQIRSTSDGTLRFTDGGGGASRIEVSPSTFKSFTSLTAAKTNLGGGGSGVPSVGIYHATGFTPDGYFSTLFLRNTNAVEMTDGFGVGMDFQIEDPTQAPVIVGSIGAVRSSADTSGSLIFRTTNAGNLLEKARITNDGNLLVGTTTNSGFMFDINGVGRVQNTFRVSNGSSGGYLDILPSNTQIALGAIYNAGTIPIRSYSTIYVGVNGDNSTYISSGSITAPVLKSKEVGGTEVNIQASATYGAIDVVKPAVADYPLVLGRYANLLIGTTTDSGHKLQVNGTVAFNALTVAGSSQDALCIVNGGTEVQRNNGAQTCTVSSARFKHDIQPLSGDILGTLTKFTPSTFIYNDQTNTRIGLIAEDVATIDPRLVFYEADGTTPRGVRYEDLAVLTLKGLQEITIQVTTLGDLTKENTLRATLTAWLGDVGNGIGKVVSEVFEGKTVKATEQLCVGNTCVTEVQLQQLLQQSGQGSVGSSSTEEAPEEDLVDGSSAPEENSVDPVGIQETPPLPTSDELVVQEVTPAL